MHIIHPTRLDLCPICQRRAYLNMQVPVMDLSDRVFLALDTIKAFDSVEWAYLWAVLEKLGLGFTFCQWIHLLYTAPRASIKVNGLQSSSFTLCRGTRQGCPLSPLLFAIAIEHLACLLLASWMLLV